MGTIVEESPTQPMRISPKVPTKHPTHGARYAQYGILILGFFVFLFSLGAFGLVRHLIKTQEQHLSDYLEPVARSIADPPRDYFWFLRLLLYTDTGEIDDQQLYEYNQLEVSSWNEMALSLQGNEDIPYIGSIHLLSPAGEIIMNAAGELAPLEERRRFFDEDGEWIRKAVETKSPVSPNLDANLDKRLYYPVSDDSGSVVAVLRIGANEEYLNELRRLRRNVLFGFITTMSFLLLIYIYTMRLVKRTIKAEHLAAQTDRLRALGTLTAGMAHEIRNPLGIISLQVEELRVSSEDIQDEKLREVFAEGFKDLEIETKRLKELVQSFLHLSKASSDPVFKSEVIDVEKVVEPLLKIWTKGMDINKRKVVYTAEGGMSLVLFQEDKLRQVFLNLLRNADEALGQQSGTVSVRIKKQGGFIHLTVSDTGPGIDKSIHEEIFDPFYTTRAEGTGLGLALSRAFVRASGGDLTVQSESGKGAAFTMKMRAADPERQKP